uniref:hypothetical protein n=1 Tax=Acinetobacter baumannii TaxID=470 RepID=UPI001C068E51
PNSSDPNSSDCAVNTIVFKVVTGTSSANKIFEATKVIKAKNSLLLFRIKQPNLILYYNITIKNL